MASFVIVTTCLSFWIALSQPHRPFAFGVCYLHRSSSSQKRKTATGVTTTMRCLSVRLIRLCYLLERPRGRRSGIRMLSARKYLPGRARPTCVGCLMRTVFLLKTSFRNGAHAINDYRSYGYHVIIRSARISSPMPFL